MKKLELFFCIIWVAAFAVLGAYFAVFAPEGGAYDETENRMLASAPAFDAQSMFGGDISEQTENYLADHVLLRAQAISACSRIKDMGSIATYEDSLAVMDSTVDALASSELDEEALAEMAGELTEPKTTPTPTPETTAQPDEQASPQPTEHEALKLLPPLPEKPAVNVEDYPGTLSVVMISGANAKAQNMRSYSRTNVLAVTSVLNRIAALLPKDGRLAYTMVPQSSVGNKYLRADEKGGFYSEAEPAVNAFSARNVIAVDAAKILGEAMERSEYVYFRSDMHWTPVGSYLVYCEMLNRMGLAPARWEDYDVAVEEPFLGTYYRDNPSGAMRDNPDRLDLVQPDFGLEWRRITGPGGEYRVIPFLDYEARANDRYTVYLGGPAGPWTYAVCDNGEERKCLVICDSFGLGFVPLVSMNYGEVHYCDPRYFDKKTVGGSIGDMIARYGISDVFVVVGDLHSYNSDMLVYQLNDAL